MVGRGADTVLAPGTGGPWSRVRLRLLRRLRRQLPLGRALGAGPARPAADRAHDHDHLRLLRRRLQRSTSTPATARSRRSRPTASAPVNRGHACVKGRFAHGFVRSPDRLTRPLIRRDGALVEASWEEALGHVGERAAPDPRRARPRRDRGDLLGAGDQRGELPDAEADAGRDRHQQRRQLRPHLPRALGGRPRRRRSGSPAAPTRSRTSIAPASSCSAAPIRPRPIRWSARGSSSG